MGEYNGCMFDDNATPAAAAVAALEGVGKRVEAGRDDPSAATDEAALVAAESSFTFFCEEEEEELDADIGRFI